MRRAENRRTPGTASATGRLTVALAVVLAVVLGLAGCTYPDPEPPLPSGSGSPTVPADPFVVVTTDVIDQADPAGVTDQGSTILSGNVFQTLMTADPGDDAPKPDAAEDCKFDAPKVYRCWLRDDLYFHNGDPLTSTDVKFSIDRAVRLAVPGSSASLFSSLRTIETPDASTVRFVLNRVDTQFVWALAAPAASIVDHAVYAPDRLQGRGRIVGSGPYRVVGHTAARLDLLRFDPYIGRHPIARVPAVEVRTLADSAAVQKVMATGGADVVWRGLSRNAVADYGSEVETSSDQTTRGGFERTVLEGQRVQQLVWDPSSPRRANRAVRTAVVTALQQDRRLDSVVPAGIGGHRASFATGGDPEPHLNRSEPVRLKLGYDPSTPDGRRIATAVRRTLRATDDFRVQLVTTGRADLHLVDRKAWTATPLAWLQPYLDAPLPGRGAALEKLTDAYRAAEFGAGTDPGAADQVAGQLQARAAVDDTVIPVEQTDETVFVRQGSVVGSGSYGPGYQLGLWGVGHD